MVLLPAWASTLEPDSASQAHGVVLLVLHRFLAFVLVALVEPEVEPEVPDIVHEDLEEVELERFPKMLQACSSLLSVALRQTSEVTKCQSAARRG